MRRAKLVYTPQVFEQVKIKLVADENWAFAAKVVVKDLKRKVKVLEVRNGELEQILANFIPDTESPLFKEMSGLSDSSEDDVVAQASTKPKANPD